LGFIVIAIKHNGDIMLKGIAEIAILAPVLVQTLAVYVFSKGTFSHEFKVKLIPSAHMIKPIVWRMHVKKLVRPTRAKGILFVILSFKRKRIVRIIEKSRESKAQDSMAMKITPKW
jgi:hypothetical protein